MWSRAQLLDQFQKGNVNTSLFTRMQSAHDVGGYELSKVIDVEKCHMFPVNSLALDRVESRYLLSSNTSGHIYIHDTAEVSEEGVIKSVCQIGSDNRNCHHFSVETVQWYPVDTGVFTSSGMDKTFKMWDTNRLKPVYKVAFSGRVYKHDLSATNSHLVLVATENSYAQVLDLNTGSKLHQLSGAHTGKILQCQWSPACENICVTGGADGRCVFWDIRYSRGHLAALDAHSASRGKGEFRKAHEGRIASLAFTADGLDLITYGADNVVRLWDACLAKKKKINFGRVRCQGAKNLQIAITDDTSPPFLAVPSQSTIKVYDTTSGELVKTLRAHIEGVNAVAYCPLNRRFYSGGKDNMILVWTKEDAPELRAEISAAARQVVRDNWSDED